jgi:hypothetical protein
VVGGLFVGCFLLAFALEIEIEMQQAKVRGTPSKTG